MWSRLLYLNLTRATQRRKFGNKWISPALSGRYRNMLNKEFRKKGLPVLTELPKDDSKNPRHKKPKGTKHQLFKKSMMEQKIKSLLPKADEEITKYRQQKLNEREYGGLNLFMKVYLKGLTSKLRGGNIEEEEENK